MQDDGDGISAVVVLMVVVGGAGDGQHWEPLSAAVNAEFATSSFGLGLDCCSTEIIGTFLRKDISAQHGLHPDSAPVAFNLEDIFGQEGHWGRQHQDFAHLNNKKSLGRVPDVMDASQPQIWYQARFGSAANLEN
jgi:hypothetical protein